MISRLRKRISYTNMVLTTLVLVFATTGGAYATKRYLITSTSQISPKVLKALRGGAGPVGVQGAQGAKGDPGAAGPAGEKGATGLQGPRGKEGQEGEEGAEGSPWTAGGVLPQGKSEKGVWVVDERPSSINPGFPGVLFAPISYGIPLKSGPQEQVIEENEPPPPGCKGNAENPEADEGNLCVFVIRSINTLAVGHQAPQGASRLGTLLAVIPDQPPNTETVLAEGTWAVTGGE